MELRTCLDLIIGNRKNADILSTNPYVFALPDNDRNEQKFAQDCDLKFSKECGANVPESLRGTLLRKHWMI